jgi:predicted enzyme related to lactoylglutathione lyase
MTEHHDPLDALRTPVVPVAPDAAFAARLRTRLESAVLNPKGTTMSSPTEAAAPVIVEENPPSEGDLAYSSLWLPDLERAEAFYPSVLGWRLATGDAGGRMVEGVTLPMGVRGGVADSTLFLCHAVDDVYAAVARVRAAGGEAEEPTRQPYGVVADCTDNQGMRFALVRAPRAERRPLPQPGAGGLLYLTVEVPNSQLFRDFYGAVFGWTFTPGRIDDGWGVTGITPMTGMHGGAGRPAVVPMYGVRDVVAAVAAVRAAGGTSTDPERMPYGTTAECADDQGSRFYLGQV